MSRTNAHRELNETISAPASDVLLVRLDPPAIEQIPTDLYTRAQSGREALALLKLLRFRLLLASLDVPDMRPWDLFARARQAQARLQCALVDDRLTLEDEQRLRQSGAGAFVATDPALAAAIAGPRRENRLNERSVGRRTAIRCIVPSQIPARAPP